MKNKDDILNLITQFAVPGFTLSAQLAIAFKNPALGLILNMIAQPFWIYSGWKAYKNAGQIGLLINTIAFTLITAVGILNYWFL